MSRCFPYPPPGYVRKVASTEAALIESIKLQSERQSKNDRKNEKRRHKKEKSKDKKERSKDKKHKSKERKEHKEKSSHSRSLNDQKHNKCLKEVKDLLDGTKVEAEQLERSGLTEEHGQPVWPQSPAYLSDGTQIDHKRKRQAETQPDEGCKPGKIIRIKLASAPSLSQQEDSAAGSEQMCSTSGRYNSFDQKTDGDSHGSVANAETAVAVHPTLSNPKIEHPPLHPIGDRNSKSTVVSVPSRKRSSAESAYEALFEEWVAPPLLLEQQTDDEEWLFGTTRKQDGRSTMANNNNAFSTVSSCGRSSNLWPRGQYLVDADVYSLPYTIPF
ncbi:DNA ligase 1-like isoform X2 [Cucumis melo var. makuwa]|uniref:DNA ligase 1-like isoform X2 n=2 Tax=Cucumis melo TaxID=3656 RepID=A0A5A7VB55_CUCMM|nr:DNA ligase 1-like isoform X2 [Cucumis melo var. makuwa]